MQKRIVILLGAGAAKAWGAALTPEISNRILTDSTFQTLSKQNLAEYLKDQLIVFHKCNPGDINFETIINTLENLIDYFRMKAFQNSNPNETSSFSNWLDTNSNVDEIMNFDFIPGGYVGGHGAVENRTNKNQIINVHPKLAEAAYLSEAIKHYMMIIKNEVANYCENALESKFDNVNMKLKDFIQYLRAKNYVPRFYTTNYDLLFPKIFETNNQINFFDGSLDQLQPDPLAQFGFSVKKIYNDRDCLNYYNLHGSIYWSVGRYFINSKEKFVCQPNSPNIYSYDTIRTMTNPGSDTIIYNIVTGYNKLQRISIEPLNAFHSSFGFDCNNADVIITIGYSFSDFHLNRSIQNGIINDSKILHISFSSKDFIQTPEFKNIEYEILQHKNDFHPPIIKGDWVYSQNNLQAIYKAGFERYLLDEEWTNSPF